MKREERSDGRKWRTVKLVKRKEWRVGEEGEEERGID